MAARRCCRDGAESRQSHQWSQRRRLAWQLVWSTWCPCKRPTASHVSATCARPCMARFRAAPRPKRQKASQSSPTSPTATALGSAPFRCSPHLNDLIKAVLDKAPPSPTADGGCIAKRPSVLADSQSKNTPSGGTIDFWRWPSCPCPAAQRAGHARRCLSFFLLAKSPRCSRYRGPSDLGRMDASTRAGPDPSPSRRAVDLSLDPSRLAQLAIFHFEFDSRGFVGVPGRHDRQAAKQPGSQAARTRVAPSSHLARSSPSRLAPLTSFPSDTARFSYRPSLPTSAPPPLSTGRARLHPSKKRPEHQKRSKKTKND
jgi:hypothetical protein